MTLRNEEDTKNMIFKLIQNREKAILKIENDYQMFESLDSIADYDLISHAFGDYTDSALERLMKEGKIIITPIKGKDYYTTVAYNNFIVECRKHKDRLNKAFEDRGYEPYYDAEI